MPGMFDGTFDGEFDGTFDGPRSTGLVPNYSYGRQNYKLWLPKLYGYGSQAVWSWQPKLYSYGRPNYIVMAP